MVDVESTSLPEELRRGGLLQWVWGIRSLLGMKRVEKRVAGDEATSIQEPVSREEPPSGDDIRDLPRDDSTSHKTHHPQGQYHMASTRNRQSIKSTSRNRPRSAIPTFYVTSPTPRPSSPRSSKKSATWSSLDSYPCG